ncbi:winged helix-turn-helix domain-containing protein [Ferdinandcohnia quinoae]|uniref:winged helix-turn-helix domain-containing protein n=1 Tax=Fredinandcohnia quinoae TaxID=2918902 RepID=UPI0023DA9626|nr:winged helix-turn-helix domain-containing protein [Fredinandcohnia sp. SECRCQ15]
MAQLLFTLTEYAVKFKGEQINLLRKEYFLLQYLYENANQAFSREQLLNSVWSMESPSDRTVDDHIYRLRKKLKPWSADFTIETVKGYGYQMTYDKNENEIAPISKDEEFHQLMEALIKKYHLYGQGEAIDTFIEKKSLGIELPKDYESIMAYKKGDFWWFIHDKKIPMSEKLYFLIGIFQTISRDYSQSITYLNNGINRNAFSKNTRYEAETLGLLFAYVFNQEATRASQYMNKLSETIAPEITNTDHGYYPFLKNIKMILALYQNDDDVFEELCNQMDEFYIKKPYQRELGIFTILKGLFLIRNGEQNRGRLETETGYEIIRKTNFKSHLFLALDVSMFLLEHTVTDDVTYKRLKERREKLNKEYNFPELLLEVKYILHKHLG